VAFAAGAIKLSVLAALVACAPPSPDSDAARELDTVDVTAKPDAAASLAADAVARPVGMPAGGVAGALPSDFPPEVPLPSPSSLVDFASGARETSVTLAVDLPADEVRATYLRQLAAGGFEARPDGSYAGHGRSLRFTVEPLHGAARLTVRVARVARP
jgi:hypothetical protein